MRKRTGGFLQKAAAIAAIVLLLPIHSAFAGALPVTELVPVGRVAGISIETEGVIVLNVMEVRLTDGSAKSPAHEAGITPGDVIIKIGKTDVKTADELKCAVDATKGKTVAITVVRGDDRRQMAVTPVCTGDGVYEIGVWLRDSMAGLGTITFYDPATRLFGALGHGVSDVDTGILVPHREGNLMGASVSGVIPGMPGKPGQLHGSFSFEDVIGRTSKNTEGGLFGTMTDSSICDAAALPVAEEGEIELGTAYILSNIEGDVTAEYQIEITRIYTGLDAIGRNMMITVTDEALLSATGGIVQGMSGSPIIQNGKLIGAVTHVLINNPAKGYAISMENMLDGAYDQTATLAA